MIGKGVWRFREKVRSVKIIPIIGITLHAVSNPKLVGTSLHFKSPSMVFGHPMTRVFKFLFLQDAITK